MDIDAVERVLAEQQQALIERVASDRGYFNEIAEFAAVRNAFRRVARWLEISDFVEPLGALESKRATWRVTLKDGTAAVLKVAEASDVGEVPALRAWRAAGVPTVEVLRTGQDGAVGYILTRFDDAPVMKSVTEARSLAMVASRRLRHSAPHRDALRDSMAEVFTALRHAHLPSDVVADAPDVTDRLMPQLEWAAKWLSRQGEGEPPGFTEAVDRLFTAPRALIHGDPSGNNMLYRDGTIVMFDGGCLGPPAYDAAQAIAENVPHGRIDEFVDLACAVDPDLRRADVASFVGVTLVLHAAYSLARDTIPGEAPRVKALNGQVYRGAEQAGAFLRDAEALLADAVTVSSAPAYRSSSLGLGG